MVREISNDDFVRVMVTNALSPMRVIDALDGSVTPEGTIAVMSSNLASIEGNLTGGWEVYRASKAALNTFMRSYAARTAGGARTLLAISPGWVRTDMGGEEAPLDVETSCRGILDVVDSHTGKGGLSYVDYLGATIAW
jgi:NAD(P)-dependent dehydrogenase (short-subunit alcohol dehydrogenase family)